MRFKGLDLNLLLALDALAETRSVSGAAQRMNLSQPAMSACLRRLREHFGDELLVVSGRRMFSTPLLQSLAPQLKDLLHKLEAFASPAGVFDPGAATRRFRIVATDYFCVTLFAPLMERLASEAAGISLEVAPPDERSLADFADGKCDLQIGPEPYNLPDHPAEVLWEERYVVVGARDNPIFQGPVTEEAVFSRGHVTTVFGRGRESFVDRHLGLLGKTRRIEMVTSSFAVVPWYLVGAERLALMHERLARIMARELPIAIAPLPFDFPVMRPMLQRHRSRANDEGLIWLRGELLRMAANRTAVA